MSLYFRLAAVVLFLFAVLEAFGWLLAQDAPKAVGFVAAGLLCWVLSTIPVTRVP